MARRATLFSEYAVEAVPPLRISGGYTFRAPGNEPAAPPASVLVALLTAYQRLEYDLGLLAPSEKELLAADGITSPALWVVAKNTPTTHLLRAGETRVAVVVFPHLAPRVQRLTDSKKKAKPVSGAVSELEFIAIRQAARQARKQADLVVGLSDWGLDAESTLMQAGETGLDILLGSGPGSGVNGRISTDGQTLWMRSYSKGKAVQRIDVLELPGGEAFQWQKAVNVRWITKPLKESIPPDPRIAEMFEALP